jgi:hypothetical protein
MQASWNHSPNETYTLAVQHSFWGFGMHGFNRQSFEVVCFVCLSLNFTDQFM